MTSVNLNYTKDEINNILSDVSNKQDKLTAGDNITIKNNVISSTSSSTGGATRPLFEHTILDYVTTDSSYGMADLNEWHTKSNHSKAYNKLVDEYENGTSTYTGNYTKVGSPTISSDYVVSGFSTSNYVALPSDFNPQSNNWEFKIKFTVGNSLGSYEKLIAQNWAQGNVLLLSLSSSKFRLYLGTGGSSWPITGESGIAGSYTVQTNTTYYLKIIFNGSNYILQYSLNDIDYITDITISSSTKIGSVKSWFGVANDGTPFNGSIALKDCYIKINNQLWWSGVWDYKTSEGLKVADNQYADNVNTEYTSNNKAWYYLLDQTNERFKLPRSKTLLDDMDSKTGTTNHLYFYLGNN